jgi:hypothetical protein
MALVKVESLKPHWITRPRPQGSKYLIEEAQVAFLVKQGYVKVLPKSKKKKDEGTD